MTCYFPGCQIPVVVFVQNEPVVNVIIAHIRGARPGSARYDAGMSDDERRSFANLVLLCKPHHDWIDRLHADRYPPELLLEWKAKREQGQLLDLGSVPRLTERLASLIESAVASIVPQRLISAEIDLGIRTSRELITIPPHSFREYFDANPELGEPVVVVKARNLGRFPHSIVSYVIRLEPDGTNLMPNDWYSGINPRLPVRLEIGQALNWLTPMNVVKDIITTYQSTGGLVKGLRAELQLGTGLSVRSRQLSIAFI
jgi:hypothetical protein